MIENIVSERVTGLPPLLARPKEAPEGFLEMWNTLPGWGQLVILVAAIGVTGLATYGIASSFGFSKGWLERDDIARADRKADRRSRGF